MDLAQRMTVFAHAALVGILLWMSGRLAVIAVAQAHSGYIPPEYPLDLALILIPLGLAGLLAWGAIEWVRAGRRRVLVAVDLSALAASWTVLLVLVLMDDSPLLALGLESVCLASIAAVRPPGARDARFLPGWASLAGSALVGMITAATGIFLLRDSTPDSWGVLLTLVALSLIATVYPVIVGARRRQLPSGDIGARH